MTRTKRAPYGGEGEDGARRSAQMDGEEADSLAFDDPRHEELLASAGQWPDQAYELMLDRLGGRPSLDQVRDSVGNEPGPAALALLDLRSARFADAARYGCWSRDGGTDTDPTPLPSPRQTATRRRAGSPPTPSAAPAPPWGWNGSGRTTRTPRSTGTPGPATSPRLARGWSSTQARPYEVIAALVTPGRGLPPAGVHDDLGTRQKPVLAILVCWANGRRPQGPPRPLHRPLTEPHRPPTVTPHPGAGHAPRP